MKLAAMRNIASSATGDTTDGDSAMTIEYGISETKWSSIQARSTGSPRITTAYAITTVITAGAKANSRDSRCGS